MATTMQQVVDQSRVPLNDDKKTRWSDDLLFDYARNALRRLRRERADLFIGSFAAPTDFTTLTLLSPFPLSEDLLEPVYDYIRARAETQDTEAVEDSKMPLFAALFKEIEG